MKIHDGWMILAVGLGSAATVGLLAGDARGETVVSRAITVRNTGLSILPPATDALTRAFTILDVGAGTSPTYGGPLSRVATVVNTGASELPVLAGSLTRPFTIRNIGASEPVPDWAEAISRSFSVSPPEDPSGVDDPGSDPVPETIDAFRLYQNVPNPFNPVAWISFDLPVSLPVRLDVYSIDGRLVATLVDRTLPVGRHAISWNGKDGDGRDAPSGVYVYRLEAGKFVQTRRMTLLK